LPAWCAHGLSIACAFGISVGGTDRTPPVHASRVWA
jgi:hypothetical protein